MNDKGHMLECRAVSKHYGALTAVDAVNLQVSVGETIGIGGPNGAGKTTFFDLISGLSTIDSGDVLLNGTSIKGIAPHRLYHMGLARTFQVTDGFGSLSVMQNMLAAVVNGKAGHRGGFLLRKSDTSRSMSALEEYGLSHLKDELVSDIPALDRKKLMVATAVVHQPQILLLDEPVGGLAPSELDEFIELMSTLRSGGLTIVFIEHVMRFLLSVADRALIMHQGQLIYDGAPQGITQDDTVKSVYLGSDLDAAGGH